MSKKKKKTREIQKTLKKKEQKLKKRFIKPTVERWCWCWC